MKDVGAVRLSRSLVAVALVVAVISSLGAPLITVVATTLGVSLAAAQWTLTVTLLSAAVGGPVIGRLGSGAYRRRTALVALGVVVLGGALTTLPLSGGFGFAVLLVGRGLQGVGLGVVAVLMGIARDQLPADRSASTIAGLSVASTVGIGVGYPLIGLLYQVAGLRVAYGAGFVLSVAALLVAVRSLPSDPPAEERERPQVDVPGALLLALGTLGVLLVVADPALWSRPWVGVVVLVAALVVLAVWIRFELGAAAPLVRLRLLAQRPVAAANAAMVIAGAAMYLVFSLLTRFLQTPHGAGYGFGLPGVVAGAGLIPFSVLGFVAGRLSPRLVARTSAPVVFVLSIVATALSAVLLAVGLGSLVLVLVAMAVLGFGVGGLSAVMPRLVLDGVPTQETASVLSINQIARAVGFSLGSALAGLLLAAATPAGRLVATPHGYVVAALVSIPVAVVGAAVLLAGRVRSPGTGSPGSPGTTRS